MVGEDKKELRRKAIGLRNKMTKAEIILWSRLRMRQVEGWKFRRQQPILDYIVDFYCHDLKLIIEVDGEIHSLPDQIKSDKVRDKMLINNGFKIIHFSNHEIETNLSSSLLKIKLFISSILSPSKGDHSGSSNEK
jgi:very-short-patch-repair endonuclease